MRRLNFWDFMVIKDDLILSVIERILELRHSLNLNRQYYLRCSKKIIAEKRSQKLNSVYVILNGPSLNSQDLSVLKGEELIFVNRGFLHPLYKELQPKYHVFIDSKMINGVWDVEWLDRILDMVPGITFAMPVAWVRQPILRKYIQRKIPIVWLSSGQLRGIGVAGACFDLSFLLGYKTIYFTGFEATGFAQDLLNKASHFYGSVDDRELQGAYDYARGYYMNCRQMRELILYARRAQHKGVSIFNLTEGGLLDMFERRKFGRFITSHEAGGVEGV